jgi:hypothetical protein
MAAQESAREMIARLMSTIGSPNPEIDELFSAMSGRRVAADQAEQSAQQQLQQAQAAPPPTTPPAADLITRAIASVAGTFQGSDQPGKNAEAMISAEQKKLMLKHASDLAQLSDVYDKAYDRATKLGVLEDQLKYAEKRAKITEDRKLANDVLDAQVRLETAQIAKDTTLEAARIRNSVTASTAQDTVTNYADALVSGQIPNIASISTKGGLRDAVVNLLKSRGDVILTPKARFTIDQLSGAKSVLSQLSVLNEEIPRGEGIERFGEGIINAVTGFLQTKGRGEKVALYQSFKEGVLAPIVRAAGDVGTLNNQDIARARALTPTIYDSDALAASKLVQLKQWIEDKQAETIRIHSQKLPGQSPATKAGTSLDDWLKSRGIGADEE